MQNSDSQGKPSEYGGVKRTTKDFRKLAQVLDKTKFGVYVPLIPQIKATEDISQNVLDYRTPNIEQSLIQNFIDKL